MKLLQDRKEILETKIEDYKSKEEEKFEEGSYEIRSKYFTTHPKQVSQMLTFKGRGNKFTVFVPLSFHKLSFLDQANLSSELRLLCKSCSVEQTFQLFTFENLYDKSFEICDMLLSKEMSLMGCNEEHFKKTLISGYILYNHDRGKITCTTDIEGHAFSYVHATGRRIMITTKDIAKIYEAVYQKGIKLKKLTGIVDIINQILLRSGVKESQLVRISKFMSLFNNLRLIKGDKSEDMIKIISIICKFLVNL